MTKKNRKFLSEKELKILQLISLGQSSSEIGAQMGYTIGTVDNYVKNMLLKTDTINRAHLVYDALKKGYIK